MRHERLLEKPPNIAGVEAVAEALRETKRTILRLVVEKVVVTGQRLEIHLALPVSGSFDLTSTRGARLKHKTPERQSTIDSRAP